MPRGFLFSNDLFLLWPPHLKAHAASVSGTGGVASHCATNILATQIIVNELGKTAEGRAAISAAFNTCEPLNSTDHVASLLSYVTDLFADINISRYKWCESCRMTRGVPMIPSAARTYMYLPFDLICMCVCVCVCVCVCKEKNTLTWWDRHLLRQVPAEQGSLRPHALMTSSSQVGIT
jgi:hypothetical protein